jgi:hypothetical protein
MSTQITYNQNGHVTPLYDTELAAYGQPLSDHDIPALEPDEDLRRAISVEDFKRGVLARVREYYKRKETQCE